MLGKKGRKTVLAGKMLLLSTSGLLTLIRLMSIWSPALVMDTTRLKILL